ncbi:MAG: deacylase [Planctomycetota bacterium]|nr:MAG: deacylase [Planctomycetota bacterium]
MTMKNLLEKRRVPFETVVHSATFDAQHLAQALHTPGAEVAKTVLLRADHDYEYVVAVLPASHMIDFDALSQFLGGTPLELATEHEIAERCPDCEFGVLPPFGTHYGAKTIVDKILTKDEYITFDSDSHTEAIRMKFADYFDVEHPLVASFARAAGGE